MRWAAALLVLLITVPIAEIAVIVFVGEQIGPLPTVLLLLGSAIVGTWLLKREGLRTLRSLRTATEAGRTPALEAVEGVFVLVGGLMMMFPGFVTDVLGLLMVLPPTRKIGARIALSRLARRLPPQVAQDLMGPARIRSRRGASYQGPPPAPPSRPPGEGRVIEGEIEP